MCFCEDGNELMLSISGKEFIVRSVCLRMESSGVPLSRW